MASANGDCLGWAARDSSGTLSPYQFIYTVEFCYADVAWIERNGSSNYPLVPGMRLLGLSRSAEYCDSGIEVHCARGSVFTLMRRCRWYCFRIPENIPPQLAAPLLFFSTSITKKGRGIESLGADHFVISSDEKEMKAMEKSLDFIINTASGGGTKQTQEMLDFCASHKVYPEIELIPINYCNEALDRLVKKDVKYRFVIDVASSLT
ncbi:hypothetical protein SASPL_120454 [Salvia splendens]|uniref:Uncharacterized protein n=1 Tax=Salvia splendens TaxID=180675 RepID=A0A8X8XQV3_SALSN|nr:hypothetical protein SASPL_120454 [Salvia splendens]